MKLSPNFSLAEMTRSSAATRLGIDNTPNGVAIAALRHLCENILEPVRAHFKAPVIITSGYRSPKLNKTIGGATNSDHCLGRAADFTVVGHSNLEVCKWIAANCAYRQVIYEFGEAGWIHASFAVADNKGETLSAKKIAGKTVYKKGLA